jgi:hypothetical protein
MIDAGTRVYLRGARFGAAGVVIRCEGQRVVIYWRDLDFFSRHRRETLVPVTAGDGPRGATK